MQVVRADIPSHRPLGWKRWFDTTDTSGITTPMKFAALKQPRLDGLVVRAIFHNKYRQAEGFNNMIKIARRIGYGYRDNDYFLTLIRYLAMPPSAY